MTTPNNNDPTARDHLVEAAGKHGGQDGGSCSEAIACTFCPGEGIDAATAMRLASGLAGGMGLPGGTCGVVTAAVLVIGLHLGPSAPIAAERREMKMGVQLFLDRFIERHGSTRCDRLSGLKNVHDPKEAAALRRSGRPEELIRSGAGLLYDVLAEMDQAREAAIRKASEASRV
ncbi:oxidoreductase [Pseudodesulfovibrio cashew]|uniref:Oxidoreductase n=1 Tax=Pseudodesulfovibrio cashew TaxID=2678688 RepID=A0A6I6JRI8_9BACT|nr:C-GCAxxG-C-C family protein [Pseudodesulfovibrio cashew]QGY40214.1 oxidoreductase [Pseudodesulfovibrio cashew]